MQVLGWIVTPVICAGLLLLFIVAAVWDVLDDGGFRDLWSTARATVDLSEFIDRTTKGAPDGQH